MFNAMTNTHAYIPKNVNGNIHKNLTVLSNEADQYLYI